MNDVPPSRMSITHSEFDDTVRDGIADALNDYANRNGLHRIAWTLTGHGTISGHPGRGLFDDHEQVPVAEMWAQHLGLAEQSSSSPYVREWSGEHDQLPVEVWAVTDWEAWEASTPRPKLREKLGDEDG